MKKKIIVPPKAKGMRLDKFLAQELDFISRAKISGLIDKGRILVAGEIKKPSFRLNCEELIQVTIPEEKNELKPYDFTVKIIYEDSDLIVVDKPQGLTVHPPSEGYYQTLVNALVAQNKKLATNQKLRPGVVHRLDKATSGVMVLAKTDLAYQSLVSQFKRRQVKKEYRALAWGLLPKDEIDVDLPLSRDKKNRLKMKVSFLGSKTARTKISVIKRLNDSTWLSISPYTGRMHQIRVHLHYLGFPIVGDKKYGIKDGYKELFLHAYKLGFHHPRKKDFREFTANLPERFKEFIKTHEL